MRYTNERISLLQRQRELRQMLWATDSMTERSRIDMELTRVENALIDVSAGVHSFNPKTSI